MIIVHSFYIFKIVFNTLFINNICKAQFLELLKEHFELPFDVYKTALTIILLIYWIIANLFFQLQHQNNDLLITIKQSIIFFSLFIGSFDLICDLF